MNVTELQTIYELLKGKNLIKELTSKERAAETIKRAFILPTTPKKEVIINEALQLLNKHKAHKELKQVIQYIKKAKQTP